MRTTTPAPVATGMSAPASVGQPFSAEAIRSEHSRNDAAMRTRAAPALSGGSARSVDDVPAAVDAFASGAVMRARDVMPARLAVGAGKAGLIGVAEGGGRRRGWRRGRLAERVERAQHVETDADVSGDARGAGAGGMRTAVIVRTAMLVRLGLRRGVFVLLFVVGEARHREERNERDGAERKKSGSLVHRRASPGGKP